MGCLSSSRSPGDDAMFCVQKDWVLLVEVSSFHVRVSWAETRPRTTGHNTAQPRQPLAGFRALSLTRIFSISQIIHNPLGICASPHLPHPALSLAFIFV